MNLSKYTVVGTIEAPVADGSSPAVKYFGTGQEVTGYVYTGEGAELYSEPIVIVEGMYAVPSSHLKFMYDLDENGNPVVLSEAELKAKELDEKLKAIKNKSIVSNIVIKSRRSVNGLLIGSGIGALTSLVFKKSLLGGILIGGIIGGMIGANLNIDFTKKADK